MVCLDIEMTDRNWTQAIKTKSVKEQTAEIWSVKAGKLDWQLREADKW